MADDRCTGVKRWTMTEIPFKWYRKEKTEGISVIYILIDVHSHGMFLKRLCDEIKAIAEETLPRPVCVWNSHSLEALNKVFEMEIVIWSIWFSTEMTCQFIYFLLVLRECVLRCKRYHFGQEYEHDESTRNQSANLCIHFSSKAI